jgi:tellurite resistance protein
MRTDVVLDDELVQMYAAVLYTISRADGTVDRDESVGLRQLVARRWQVSLDPEALFFTTVTPESFAHAVSVRDPFRGSAAGSPKQIARALIDDAVVLCETTGGLDDRAAHAILRFARALGCTSDDIVAASQRLAEWID